MPAPAKKPAAATVKIDAKGAAKPTKNKPAAKGATSAPSIAPVKAAVPKSANAGATKPAPSPAERQKMIAETAYYLAQKRGFAGGDALSDWVAAEKQVDSQIANRS